MRKWAKWFKGGSAPKLPAGPIDLLAPEIVADPYPLYAQLRAERPVAALVSGGVLVTRHADIVAAMGMKQLGNAPSRMSVLAPRNRGKYPAADLAAHIPPFLDMPAHKLPRQAVSRAVFAAFRAQGPRLGALAQQAVAAHRGEVELIGQISSGFALRAMAAFVGIEADPARLKAMSQAFFHLFAPLSDPAAFHEVNAQITEARALFLAAVARVRGAPGEDVLSALVAVQADHPALTDAMIADNALLIFADGIENIEAGAATVLHRLAQEGQGPVAEVAPLVREALRLNSPAQIIPRVVREPITLHGQELASGQPVFLALGSGNVDSNALSRPEVFDPARTEQAVTFGLGRHRCIGEPLGLAMLSALTAALLERGAEVRQGPLEYVARFGHRWPRALAVYLP